MLCGRGRSADQYRPSHLGPESDRPTPPAMRQQSRSPLVWHAHWQEEPAPNALLPTLRGVGSRGLALNFGCTGDVSMTAIPSSRTQAGAPHGAPRPTARPSRPLTPQGTVAILATFLFCRARGPRRTKPSRVEGAEALDQLVHRFHETYHMSEILFGIDAV